MSEPLPNPSNPLAQAPKPPTAQTVQNPSTITPPAQPTAKAPSGDKVVTLTNGKQHTIKANALNDYHIEVEQEVPNQLVKSTVPHVVAVIKADFQRYIRDIKDMGMTMHNIHHDPQPEVTAKILVEVEAAGKMRTTKKDGNANS